MKLLPVTRRDYRSIAMTLVSAIFLISVITYIGIKASKPGNALTGNGVSLTMQPGNGNYAPGSIIPVEVRVNSAIPVTVVRAVIQYPTNQLQFTGVQEGSAFTSRLREKPVTNTIDVIRGVTGGNSGYTGNNIVFTAIFKVVGNGGTAPLTFTNLSEAYDNTGSGVNILNTAELTGASYILSISTGANLYRMANWKTKERLFTTNWEEVVAAQKNDSGWVYENIAMQVFTNNDIGRTAVYRMANWKTKERLFTTDFNEVQYAARNLDGWSNEGVEFYASTNSANTTVYRMANWQTKERLFTTDSRERDAIRDKNGWVYEGVAFYAAN
jgi:hypothetical protein